MSVCGMIELEIEVGGFKFTWPGYTWHLYVMTYFLDGILSITTSSPLIQKKDFGLRVQWLSLEVTQQKRNVAGIEILNVQETVPANSEFVVSCQCEDTFSRGIIYSNQWYSSRVIAAKAMVRPYKERMFQ